VGRSDFQYRATGAAVPVLLHPRASRYGRDNTYPAPATTLYFLVFIAFYGYGKQYAGVHSEARVDHPAFLSNFHGTAEQFSDECACFLSLGRLCKCCVEIAHDFAIEPSRSRESCG